MPTTPPQEAYIAEDVADIARKYLNMRYRILPFWYTAFAKVNKFGGSVVQPVWAVYPPKEAESAATVMQENNDPFLVNRNLLVVPIVTKNQTSVRTWIPSGLWYDAMGGGEMYFRGGSIIPTHYNRAGKTTVDFKASGLALTIALDESKTAQGDLYLDDGATFSSGKSWISFKASMSPDSGLLELAIDGEFGYLPAEKQEITVREVTVLGLGKALEAKTMPAHIILDSVSEVALTVL
ncbi:Maltase [Dactylella cylindrospora]|nr:Maltase [Dactylella cylindrospora]